MAYTNETLHYGIPKPLGTDLTVPMDYNDAADVIDQALFDASTNASEAVSAAANAVDAAAGAVEDVGDLGTEVNNLKGRTSALETSDVIQNNKIDNLENQGVTKFDSVGIADAYVNGLTYSVGDVVTYNGQRYKCTTAVVAAEPFDADKWSAEDVETVINELKSDLVPLSPITVAGDGVKTYETVLNTIYSQIDKTKIRATSNLVIVATTNTSFLNVGAFNDSLISTQGSANNNAINYATLKASNSTYYQTIVGNTQSTNDYSSAILAVGESMTFNY